MKRPLQRVGPWDRGYHCSLQSWQAQELRHRQSHPGASHGRDLERCLSGFSTLEYIWFVEGVHMLFGLCFIFPTKVKQNIHTSSWISQKDIYTGQWFLPSTSLALIADAKAKQAWTYVNNFMSLLTRKLWNSLSVWVAQYQNMLIIKILEYPKQLKGYVRNILFDLRQPALLTLLSYIFKEKYANATEHAICQIFRTKWNCWQLRVFWSS